MADDFPYDLALSFLDRDRNIALDLQSKLGAQFKTFVYTSEQARLAGTDGMESLRRVFLEECRLAVVLYRDGWGATKFTSVEERAIKDRCFDGGWDNLLFVVLHENAKPPKWLPKQHIRLSLAEYSIDEAVGAIKRKVQELGAENRRETAKERARRIQKDQELLLAREERLRTEGYNAALEHANLLFDEIERQTESTTAEAPGIKLVLGKARNERVLRSLVASLLIYTEIIMPAGSGIKVAGFSGIVRTSQEYFAVYDKPSELFTRTYYFDLTPVKDWCWTEEGSTNTQSFTSQELAEHLMTMFLELHDEQSTLATERRTRR